MRIWLAGGAIAVMAVLFLCAGAWANPFRVQTCTIREDDAIHQHLGPTIGRANLRSGWDVGWSDLVAATVEDQCLLGDRFDLRVRGGSYVMPGGQSVWFRWTAAPGTQLTGLMARWGAYGALNPNTGQGTAQLTAATDQQNLLAQNTPLSFWYGIVGAPPFESPIVPAQWFELRFTCLDRCSTPADPALEMFLLSAQFEVDDPAPPTGGVTGSATDARTWSGHMGFGLNAADVGGGVFRAVVELGGADALTVPLGDSSGTCRDIGPSPGLHEFAAAQPCPLRIDNGSLDIDTAKLPAGQHVVRILLEDAAGNRTTIFGPLTRNITTSAAIGPGSDPTLRGAANGDGASDVARLTAHWGRRGNRTLLVSPYGRTHVVRGRLRTTDGEPIANAVIDVVSKTTAVNARELGKRVGPRTGSDGRWYLVLPRGVSSRDVTFRYRSHVSDTVASAIASVRLRVRAGLRLAIHPRRARQGQAIRFSGRLLGGPLPRGGKQVVLMARASRGAWVRFNVVRTDLRGRFRTTYRFQQPGAALYRFRALSLSEAAYPYLAGGSNVVKVRKG